MFLKALNYKLQREILTFDPQLVSVDAIIRKFVSPFVKQMENGIRFAGLADVDGKPIQVCGSLIGCVADMLARWELLHMIQKKTPIMRAPLVDFNEWHDILRSMSPTLANVNQQIGNVNNNERDHNKTLPLRNLEMHRQWHKMALSAIREKRNVGGARALVIFYFFYLK